MKSYLDALQTIVATGVDQIDRTQVGTRSLFGMQIRFCLGDGFPLLTTKQLYIRGIIHELLWFLKGDTNTAYLNNHNVHIWDAWADQSGDLGPVYGKQWRSWKGTDSKSIDQISHVVEQIKTNPASRRLVVSSWNVAELDQMALPPCHLLFQFHVSAGKLSCQLYQRSADMFLGVPFNIASYALLTHMVAQQCNLDVGDFIWTAGNAHIYHNHFEAVSTQLARLPKALPILTIKRCPSSIFDYQFDDFSIANYDPHPTIKAAVAV